MSDPADAGRVEIPRPPEGWWERVPLLRELYKLLASDEPVNWDLALQVAVALASEGEPAAEVGRAQAELEALSDAALVEAQGFSGLTAASFAPAASVTRAQWVESNLGSFRGLMNPLAEKMAGGATGAPAQAAQVLRQVSGVFLGLQTGFVLGYLARHVVGQYEVPLPPAEPRLLYVVSNLEEIERDWQLDPRQFRYWIALHEVTHHIELSRPWVRRYFRSQIRAVIDSLDFDPTRLETALDVLDPEGLAAALADPERIIQAAWTPQSHDAVARLQAFMTLAEGYATFVMDAVGARVLSDHPRLKEVVERRKRTSSPGEALFERLLGLDLKRRQYQQGVDFCRYVAAVRDLETLNRAWDNPESLPTSAELREPETWLRRVAPAG